MAKPFLQCKGDLAIAIASLQKIYGDDLEHLTKVQKIFVAMELLSTLLRWEIDDGPKFLLTTHDFADCLSKYYEVNLHPLLFEDDAKRRVNEGKVLNLRPLLLKDDEEYRHFAGDPPVNNVIGEIEINSHGNERLQFIMALLKLIQKEPSNVKGW